MKPSNLVFALVFGLGFSVVAQADFIANEYVVKLKQSVSASSRGLLFRQISALSPRSISEQGHLILVKSDKDKFQLASLLKDVGVEYIEPNYIYKLVSMPNDPKMKGQWGIVNKKSTDINVLPVWEQMTGSPDVIVAVSDTGINSKHKDLQQNMWVNQAELNGKPGVDDDGNGFIDDVHGYHFVYPKNPGSDQNGHGTHCAGIIGAAGDNGLGVVGVNWKTNLMTAGFLSGSGSGSLEDAIKSIDYAVKMGAKVISASWGSTEYSVALGEAIDRANKAGVVFVAAAGNDGKNNDKSSFYPANYDLPNLISVAAVDSSGRKASFSNYGLKKVHVGAPGVSVLSTYGNSYANLDGTSMATPFVSGVVALMIQKNPSLTPDEIKQKIMRTVKPLKSLEGKVASGGMVNAEAAVFGQ